MTSFYSCILHRKSSFNGELGFLVTSRWEGTEWPEGLLLLHAKGAASPPHVAYRAGGPAGAVLHSASWIYPRWGQSPMMTGEKSIETASATNTEIEFKIMCNFCKPLGHSTGALSGNLSHVLLTWWWKIMGITVLQRPVFRTCPVPPGADVFFSVPFSALSPGHTQPLPLPATIWQIDLQVELASFFPCVQRQKHWKFPLYLNFHWKKSWNEWGWAAKEGGGK